MFQINEAFVFLAVIGERSGFQAEVPHLARYLSAHDFNYPKILFHYFEE